MSNPMRKWELSVLVGAAAAVLWSAVSPSPATYWWTTAFSPLCGELLNAESTGEGIVLRSKLCELLASVF